MERKEFLKLLLIVSPVASQVLMSCSDAFRFDKLRKQGFPALENVSDFPIDRKQWLQDIGLKNAMSFSEMESKLKEQIAQDFIWQKCHFVEGWYLSRTEVLLAQIASEA